MKTIKFLFGLTCMMALVVFTGCGDDEEAPDPVTVLSIEAVGNDLESGSSLTVDLNGATAATGVPIDPEIVITFSAEIDATTATSAIVLSVDGSDVTANVSVTGAVATISAAENLAQGGNYTITIGAGLAGTSGGLFTSTTRIFTTQGRAPVVPPNVENQTLYMNFDFETTVDEANAHVVSGGDAGFTVDRLGIPGSALALNGTGMDVVEIEGVDLLSASLTLSFWMNTASSDYEGISAAPQARFMMGMGVERGFFFELGRRTNDPTNEAYNEFFFKVPTNHKNIGDNAAAVPQATAWSELNSNLAANDNPEASGWSFVNPLIEGNRSFLKEEAIDSWTHFVLSVDANAQTKTMYLNGVKIATFQWLSSGSEWLFADLSLKDINDDGSPLAGVDPTLMLGFAGGKDNTATGWADYSAELEESNITGKNFFKGSLDELRMFSVAFSDAEVTQLFNAEKP